MSRLLLVSDPNHEYSHAFYDALRESGVESHVASSGYDCLQEIRCQPPDILLLSGDPNFGFIDWVLHLVRPTESHRPAPQLFLIGSEPPQILSARWQLPVETCLRRPLDEDQFLERIGCGIANTHDRTLLTICGRADSSQHD